MSFTFGDSSLTLHHHAMQYSTLILCVHEPTPQRASLMDISKRQMEYVGPGGGPGGAQRRRVAQRLRMVLAAVGCTLV